MNFKEKLEALQDELRKQIIILVNTDGIGKRNDCVSENVLQLEEGEHDELMYNIEGVGAYVVAVSPYALISNTGYTYSHEGIDLEKLCEIVDAFTPV